ncbi:MAG: bifunctional (p)ppGpp synthetase/guanosine-3',5'-bis(diphosphate) 3'-pyrophosphohydrolase [Bacteroidetes bacterium]|uniref:Bifunctional (P)ppGpp synthetase/guanosine-3',5'-bis(Diphosphate) 3'-pyrophosphohydrolase n=1 Tax=Candidatus Caccoplasma merdipullorum TaxID=2840718 RepID=A0A9D9E3K5_9BACT|nr:bifunctional (p)ppGpp synthetase/guanosine-3',5'-bis(diphosphate) 3'-pyrophosphohydrolase [Candidatus Caccoplasma merdipullorum]
MEEVKLSEDEIIENEFQTLLSEYLASNHRKKVEIIERAYKFAKQAHQGILRQSGEPYILHPIAVARIACKEIGLGSTSICAALLHDVAEDTEYTIEDIERLFGKKIAQLVDGLTKIAGGIFGDKASEQAENFRKLLLTMSEDIRVILIKMADRLHNMRTLSSLPQKKQYKIAGETLYIYAPLAHRLGLFSIKSELEDLSFKYESPKIYEEISQKIAESEEIRQKAFKTFSLPIVKRMDERGIKYEIKARIKSVYSIWKKMDAKNIPFEEVYDLYAVRIIFDPKRDEDEKRECWEIYSIITDIYRLHPDRIRDWVSRPKANGYQALHVTVMGSDGNWVEVQIRSRKMDEIAERGFAAHWKYKTGDNNDNENYEENELDIWLKTIKEILESPEPNALDFLDTIKLNLYASEIFVFTPKGEIKTLPKDATALDFAFTLHSDVGYHCIAAKVNHKLVPLSQKLQSGDQVEILTSKSQHPKQEWINFVTTAKSKTRLINALRKERKIVSTAGEEIYKKFAEEHKINPDDLSMLDKIMNHFGVVRKEELFYLMGNNDITLDDGTLKAISEKRPNIIFKYLKKPFTSLTPSKLSDTRNKEDEEDEKSFIDRTSTFVIRPEEENKRYNIAPCCNPVPGDDVLGYVNDNETVTIHKIACPVALRLKSSFGERLVVARWKEAKAAKPSLVSIEISGIDTRGILNQITTQINNLGTVDIRSINMEAKDGLFYGKIGLTVHSVQSITEICNNLKKIKEVKSATRINQAKTDK